VVSPLTDEYLDAFFTSAPAALGLLDRELRLIKANDRGVEMIGVPREQLLGRPVRDVLPALADALEPLLDQILTTGQPTLNRHLSGETPGRPGITRDWVVSCFPVPAGDPHPPAIGIIAVEESERRMSRALAQAQKMEAIGQLTSGIAHDFNNLLTVILAHAKFIGDELPPSPPELHDDLRALQTAARQGAELVHKVLALSRNESLAPRPFDLVPATQDVLATLRRMLPANIEIRVTAAEPVPVHADPAALQQILLNLATNARDAMPAGGALHVAVRPDRLEEEDRRLHPWIVPGRYGCLEVGDTGTGMDAETLAHAFEPFFTTKPVEVGTGLGLAMVYGLVKQQRGFVFLHSEVGAGTTAKIYLPLAGREAPAHAEADVAEPSAGGTERILLLEDDAHLRRVAERVLARAGYRVRSAADAQVGLALYEADPGWVDLILTDFMMPGLDGMQLYQLLQRQGRMVKVVFSSGYSDQPLRERLQPGDDVAFITKPWTAAQLLRTVRAALDDAL
jgi:two-component system cell cycle sensor histidine kinase/response regulator CckA